MIEFAEKNPKGGGGNSNSASSPDLGLVTEGMVLGLGNLAEIHLVTFYPHVDYQVFRLILAMARINLIQ